MLRTAILVLCMSLTISSHANESSSVSSYAGMETREIKSLSEQDINDLRNGAGWGLALPAELNGIPGPAHLLELKEPIGLTQAQVTAIERIFTSMQEEAKEAGLRFIAAEAAIEEAFREGGLTAEQLKSLIEASSAARTELRLIHLSRHLETPPLLTDEQITLYRELRGYGTPNPCDAVPEGHNPAMWRRHNGCEE